MPNRETQSQTQPSTQKSHISSITLNDQELLSAMEGAQQEPLSTESLARLRAGANPQAYSKVYATISLLKYLGLWNANHKNRS